jgi:hypothetical protein
MDEMRTDTRTWDVTRWSIVPAWAWLCNDDQLIRQFGQRHSASKRPKTVYTGRNNVMPSSCRGRAFESDTASVYDSRGAFCNACGLAIRNSATRGRTTHADTPGAMRIDIDDRPVLVTGRAFDHSFQCAVRVGFGVSDDIRVVHSYRYRQWMDGVNVGKNAQTFFSGQ